MAHIQQEAVQYAAHHAGPPNMRDASTSKKSLPIISCVKPCCQSFNWYKTWRHHHVRSKDGDTYQRIRFDHLLGLQDNTFPYKSAVGFPLPIVIVGRRSRSHLPILRSITAAPLSSSRHHTAIALMLPGKPTVMRGPSRIYCKS